MKTYLLKIILFSILGSSIVFAGGVEEDSGPETISDAEQQVSDESTNYDAELTTREDVGEYQEITREDIDEYQEIVATLGESSDPVCDSDGNVVKWSGGCVIWSGGYLDEGETADTFVRYSN